MSLGQYSHAACGYAIPARDSCTRFIRAFVEKGWLGADVVSKVDLHRG
jgi:hypothetical protein